jgi:amidophosphoribosyltransferase
MGVALAEQAPVDADVVVPVPESGIPAAQGFAEASGIRYTDGLVKNRYIGRTFIEPAQALRDRGIRLKLNAMPGELAGKTEDEIARFLAVDSIGYLELDRLIDATGVGASTFCTACLSGDYPTGVPAADAKYALERSP